jgi:hypothetical protein
MTSRDDVAVDAAHEAAAAAIEKLYAEAMSHIDAAVRSFATPAEAEQAPSEPGDDDSAGPATMEIPRGTTSPAWPVAAAA